MATKKITYEQKVGIIPKTIRINQVWDDDMNHIKDVVNTNADQLAQNTQDITNLIGNPVTAATVSAVPSVQYLLGTNVQAQLNQTEASLIQLYRTDKEDFKNVYQTGIERIDADVTVLTMLLPDALQVSAVNNILFVNEINISDNTNKLPNFIKSFGDLQFISNAANTPLAADTRGIFYLGVDKLGALVYRTSKVYDQDVCYLARVIVVNTAGVYNIDSYKYIPDLANNRTNNRDRVVSTTGYLTPSGAASISFANKAMTFYKNSINYANNKSDPNYLQILDSPAGVPLNFLFALPNLSSLATNLALSTIVNPTQWYNAAGAVGAGAVAPNNYQVFRVLLSVTGTVIIQTKASTSNAPAPGVNAIFATRDAALAGLTSTVFPDILPAGDAIPLGTFYLRAGTNPNGSTMNDTADFYFRGYTSSSSSSTVGVTEHDLLSGKNSNPNFLHVTSVDIANWNGKASDVDVVHKSGPETLTGFKTWVLPVDQGAILIDMPLGINTAPDGIMFKIHGTTNPAGGSATATYTEVFGTKNIAHLVTPQAGATLNEGYVYSKKDGVDGNIAFSLHSSVGVTFKVDDLGNLTAQNIQAIGNFGVQGTSVFTNHVNIQANLTVEGAVYCSQVGSFEAESDFIVFGSPDAGDVIFTTGTIERMRIKYGGNVLIGTPTDLLGNNKLQVAGNIYASTGIGTDGTVSADYISSNTGMYCSDLIVENKASVGNIDAWNYGEAFYFNHGDPGSSWNFRSNGVVKMKIDYSGNVGIGTLTPARKLVIVSADAEQLILASSSASNLAGMFFNPADTSYTPFIGGTQNHLVFYTQGAERIRVTAAGNLVVGSTIDTGDKLSVFGNQFISGNIYSQGKITARPPIGDFTPVGGTGNNLTDYSSFVADAKQVNQSDTDYYPMLTGNNVLLGIGYTNNPSIGWMRPLGDYGQSGDVVIQNIGDGTPLVRWKFKANGQFESPKSVISNAPSNYGVIVSNSGISLGSVGDYVQTVVLLHEMYDGVTLLNRNCVNGKIQVARGGNNSGLVGQTYNINSSSAYAMNYSAMNSTYVSFDDQKLYTCLYGGKLYICIRNVEGVARDFFFEGNTSIAQGLSLVVIPYNSTQSGVMNAEVYNSLAVYTPIGDTNFQGSFSITGNLSVSGTVTAASDARFKENIRPIENALARVIKAEGIGFDRIGGDKNQIGFVAQDLEKVFPELVVTAPSAEGFKAVNYQSMVAILVEAIKEQQLEIDTLKSKLN